MRRRGWSNCGTRTRTAQFNSRFANLAEGFPPFQGMTNTMRFLLISATLSMPVLAQPAARSNNSFLDEALFPRLKTDQQVAELVKQAGFQPTLNGQAQLNRFQAVTPRCTVEVWFSIAEDKTNLEFVTKIRELTDEEAPHYNALLAQLKQATPPGKFNMYFEVLRVSSGKLVLLLDVMLPNRGATPSEVTDVVSQLAEVALAALGGH